MKTASLLLAAFTIGITVPACAEPPIQSVLQLYSYRLVDPPRFREGYRAHLGWHARRRDPLSWYGWTVQAGPRRGMFIDGTAGVTLGGLDVRPDLAADGADFAETVGDSAQPVDIETWALWPVLSSAASLEDRRPSATVDVFLLTVLPGEASAFERGMERIARDRHATTARLTWYRRMRGGGAAGYMLLVSRERWADIALVGGTLNEVLRGCYGAADAEVASVLRPVKALALETWRYEAQLSLLPDRALEEDVEQGDSVSSG